MFLAVYLKSKHSQNIFCIKLKVKERCHGLKMINGDCGGENLYNRFSQWEDF